ncbi:hypothetical protein CHUAL_014070 [Chamberlinius hualienensis]
MTSDKVNRLQAWACNDFDYKTSVDCDLQTEEFRGLCRMPLLLDIWSYVTEYVRPLPVVMQIREQLKRKRHVKSSEIQIDDDDNNLKDLSRRMLLLNEVATDARDVKESASKLDRLNEDISHSNAIRYYMTAYSEMMKNGSEDYSSAIQQLENCIANLRKESKPSQVGQFYSRKDINGEFVVSTECMKATSEHCSIGYDKIIEIKDSLKEKGLNTLDMTDNIITEVFAAKDVMSSLSSLIDERLEFLQKKLNSLNVENDLKNLQFQKDPIVGFIDKPIKKASSLMTTGMLMVVDKMTESDQIRMRRSQFAEENNSVLDFIKTRRNDPLTIEFIDDECHLNALNKQLKLLMEVSYGIESELKTMFPYQTYIKYGFAKIKSFNDQKEQKENTVCRLMQINHGLLSKLGAKLATIESLKTSNIKNTLSSLMKLPSKAIETGEVDFLRSSSGSSIGVTRLNNKYVLTSTLSINRNFPESSIDVDNFENCRVTDMVCFNC